jgi:hypothetical protein
LVGRASFFAPALQFHLTLLFLLFHSLFFAGIIFRWQAM